MTRVLGRGLRQLGTALLLLCVPCAVGAALPEPPAAGLLGGEPGAGGLLDPGGCGPQGAAPCPTPDTADAPPKGENPPALLPVGTPAHPIDLLDPEGRPVLVEVGPGMNPTLLVFWSMFCEPCKEDLPLYGDLAQSYGPRGLRLASVNVDGVRLSRAVARFAQLNDVPFPVAVDRREGTEFLAAGAYGVSGTPSLFLVGADGTVRWRHSGRVDPATLRAQVERVLSR